MNGALAIATRTSSPFLYLLRRPSQAFSQQTRTLQQEAKSGFAARYRAFFNPTKKNTRDSKPGLHCYDHVVQVGDPVLRTKASPVPPEQIRSATFQAFIAHMKKLGVTHDAVGLSAPQLGAPLQIIVIQLTEKQLKDWPAEVVAKQGMELIPQRVLINPKLTVLDNSKEIHREGCCSLLGFSAVVERYKKIRVNALDEDANEVELVAKDWTARVVQHELDHLEGKVFTDIMRNETFMFNYWEDVNKRAGDFALRYTGMKGLMQKWLGI